MTKELYNYRIVELVKVVDGDTIDLRIDLGFDVFKKVRCRLARVNAPEMGTQEGKDFKKLVVDKLTITKPTILNSIEYDKYGRSVAEVILEDGVNFSNYLLNQGCPSYR